jgi:hypothetical protein
MKLIGHNLLWQKKLLQKRVGVGHQVTGPPEYKDRDGWVMALMGARTSNPHNPSSLACP